MGDVRWGVLWILRRYVCALRGCKRDYPILNRVAEEPFSKELNEMQGLGNSPKVRKFWKFLQKVARIWFPTQCLRPMMPSGRKRLMNSLEFRGKKRGFPNVPNLQEIRLARILRYCRSFIALATRLPVWTRARKESAICVIIVLF